jgi:hypothetical protein
MSAPSELHVDRSTIPGRALLRATSSVNNRGSGPLELRARRTGPDRMVVYQAIYDRSARPHLFPIAAKLVFKHVPGERYEYPNVGAFSYWKFEHAAAFELWSIDAHERNRRTPSDPGRRTAPDRCDRRPATRERPRCYLQQLRRIRRERSRVSAMPPRRRSQHTRRVIRSI